MRPVFCFLVIGIVWELSVEFAARLWFVGFVYVCHVRYARKPSVYDTLIPGKEERLSKSRLRCCSLDGWLVGPLNQWEAVWFALSPRTQ